jgi:hypothetical protein
MFALIARVRNLLLSPRAEWDAIDREEAEPRKLALGYVAPLAALPAIAIVIGLSVLGVQIGGHQYRAPLVGIVASALLFYALTLAAVFVFASVINWLAPRFGAERSYRQAFKVSAYSITAAMLAGFVTIVPALGVLALLGSTYSLYLLFLGTPKVMHAPEKSGVNYAIVTTFAAILIALGVGLAAMFAAGPTGSLFPQMARLPDLSLGAPSPGAPVKANTILPASAGELVPGGPAPADTNGDLRNATPLKLAGLDRVAVGVERRGLPGSRTVQLDAEYRRGSRYLTLQIVFSSSIARDIGFGGPSTSEFDRETSDGYSRRRRIGEAIIVEDWNQGSQSGSYGRLAGDRFYVKASGGGGVKPEELRESVELFGQQTLAQFEAES